MDTGLKKYGRGTRFGLFIARFFGSLLISASILMFFAIMFVGTLNENVDKIQDIAPVIADKFFEEHRAEIRALLVEQSGIPEPETLEEKKKLDAMAYDALMEGFLSEKGSENVKREIRSVLHIFLDKKSLFYILSAIAFAVGAFLIFASYIFRPFISLYKLAISIVFDTFMVALAFWLFSRITPEKVSAIFSSVGGVLFGPEAANAPSVIIQLSASVLVAWVNMSAIRIFFFGLIALGASIAVVVALRIYNYVKRTKAPEK